MNNDFVIDDLSGYLRASKNKQYGMRARQRFVAVISFLETRSLLAPESSLDSAHVNDQTKIMKSDLTDIGFTLMKTTYPKWLQAIDQGQDPSDVSLFEEGLQGLEE